MGDDTVFWRPNPFAALYNVMADYLEQRDEPSSQRAVAQLLGIQWAAFNQAVTGKRSSGAKKVPLWLAKWEELGYPPIEVRSSVLGWRADLLSAWDQQVRQVEKASAQIRAARGDLMSFRKGEPKGAANRALSSAISAYSRALSNLAEVAVQLERNRREKKGGAGGN